MLGTSTKSVVLKAARAADRKPNGAEEGEVSGSPDNRSVETITFGSKYLHRFSD